METLGGCGGVTSQWRNLEKHRLGQVILKVDFLNHKSG